MTWKGWIIKESLEDKYILDKIKIIKSIKENNTEGDKAVTWNIVTAEVNDKDIDNISKKIQNSIKLKWYAHFTNYKNLIIIFKGKLFKIKIEKILKETETGATEFKSKELNKWKEAFEYGTQKGKVDKRYMLKVD